MFKHTCPSCGHIWGSRPLSRAQKKALADILTTPRMLPLRFFNANVLNGLLSKGLVHIKSDRVMLTVSGMAEAMKGKDGKNTPKGR